MTLREAFNWLMYGKEPDAKQEPDVALSGLRALREQHELQAYGSKWLQRSKWSDRRVDGKSFDDYAAAGEMPPLPLRAPFPEEVLPEPWLKFDFLIRASASNILIEPWIRAENLAACVLLADGGALIIRTNHTATPDLTITLTNGALMFWSAVFPAALFERDVNKMFLTNPGSNDVRFRMVLHYEKLDARTRTVPS